MLRVDSDLFGLFVEQLVENTRLTERQSEVYTLRQCGYSSQDIAEELGISSEAVNSHHSSARDKFSMNLSMRDLHFYKSASGRVPLYWEHVIDIGDVSYILSKSCVEFLDGGVRTLEDDVWFLTVYSTRGIDTEHIVLENKDVFELSNALNTLFGPKLTKEDAKLFESFYTQVVDDSVSLVEFYRLVFDGLDVVFSDDFLGELSEETRFVAFSETAVFSGKNEIFLGSSIETDNFISLRDVTESGWVSIVGKIGSGKTYTFNLIVSQLSVVNDGEIVEFNPFVENREEVVEHEVYPSDASEVDDGISDWFDAVFDKVDNEEVVYAVCDEAHYLLQNHTEDFVKLIEVASDSQYLTLITSTQTVSELIEVDQIERVCSDATWLFQRLDGVDEDAPMYIPSEVSRLNSNPREGKVEAILSEGDTDGGLKYFVSFDGVSADTFRRR